MSGLPALPVGARLGAFHTRRRSRLPRKHVQTSEAPAPIGPYSQGVVAGGFLFVSGQIPLDPKTNELVEGDVEVQTERVMENLMAILKEAKLDAGRVAKTTIYLANMDDFPRVNGVYGRYFPNDPPARATVEVSRLPKGVAVEIDLIAVF
jgi:2-iminobutanoate/2-iminopropanoate deaminase